MSDETFLQAKVEEILSELNQIIMQLSSLRTERAGVEEALKRLEKLEGVEEVFERVGVVYLKRDRDSVLTDLKATKEALDATIEALEKRERDLRETLNRMLGSEGGA